MSKAVICDTCGKVMPEGSNEGIGQATIHLSQSDPLGGGFEEDWHVCFDCFRKARRLLKDRLVQK